MLARSSFTIDHVPTGYYGLMYCFGNSILRGGTNDKFADPKQAVFFVPTFNFTESSGLSVTLKSPREGDTQYLPLPVGDFDNH